MPADPVFSLVLMSVSMPADPVFSLVLMKSDHDS